MSEEFFTLYNEIKSVIKIRLQEFRDIRDKGDTNVFFKELCFCLLTPQSKARNADKAIKSLSKSGKLFNSKDSEIAEELNIVRFKNNKAKYIVEFRNYFYKSKENSLIKLLESDNSIIDKRKYLVKNIKGIGFKEASHFLRNIGFFEDITILDRHILKNLKLAGVISEIPKTLTEKIYLDIENKMKSYAKKINIPLEYLDFVFWYKEAGEVFK